MALEDTLALADTATPTPASTPAETPAVTTPAEIDPDDAEVAAARTDAEKPDATVTAAPASATPTPVVTSATPQPASEDPDQVMIPKWRFDQQVAKEREAAARLAGENEALKLMIGRKPGETPAPAAKSPDDQLKDIRDARRVIAKKFDDGEISRLQEAEELEALTDREYGVRQEQWKAANAPAQPARTDQPDVADDMRLDELTVQLAAKHEYVDFLSDEQRDFLVVEATRQLQKEGVNFAAGNLPAPQRFVLRERVAKLSDAYGPVMTGKTIAELKGIPPGAQPKPGLSPTAQARDAKLDLARNAPPNLSNISGKPGSTEATDDQIAMMDDDAIAALPKATRNRILGLSA